MGLNQDEYDDNDMDEEYGDDEEEEIDSLPPERKVRHRIFKFVNKLRKTYHLNEFEEDILANRVAMEYAKFLLTNKENEAEFNRM